MLLAKVIWNIKHLNIYYLLVKLFMYWVCEIYIFTNLGKICLCFIKVFLLKAEKKKEVVFHKYCCFEFFRDYILKKLKVNTHFKKQMFLLLELWELRLPLQKTSDIFGELIYSLVAYQFIKIHKKWLFSIICFVKVFSLDR